MHKPFDPELTNFAELFIAVIMIIITLQITTYVLSFHGELKFLIDDITLLRSALKSVIAIRID